jgi:hypothetical protein
MLCEIYQRVLRRSVLVTSAMKALATTKMFRDEVKRVRLTPGESVRALAE